MAEGASSVIAAARSPAPDGLAQRHLHQRGFPCLEPGVAVDRLQMRDQQRQRKAIHSSGTSESPR